jgi:hypothetical protein
MRSCINCKYSYRAYVNGKLRCNRHKGHKAYINADSCEDWEHELADVLYKEDKKNEIR